VDTLVAAVERNIAALTMRAVGVAATFRVGTVIERLERLRGSCRRRACLSCGAIVVAAAFVMAAHVLKERLPGRIQLLRSTLIAGSAVTTRAAAFIGGRRVHAAATDVVTTHGLGL
jgi:hypothetical protein